MNIATQLADIFSLSDYESRLYLAALEEEEATVSALSVRANIPRTAVYPPLKSLVRKGFLSPFRPNNKRILYRPIEPKHLQHLFERKRFDLQEIIDQFSRSFFSNSGEVSVRYFEGVAGIENAADIFLDECNTTLWKTFENPEIAEHTIGNSHFDRYVNERVSRGIYSRIIIPGRNHTPWMKEMISKAEEKLLEIRFVSPEDYPISATIAVAGNWIFAASGIKKPFALLIKNTSLAHTFGSMHDMIWDRFKP